jgi:LDH2 family malate/lactate/ureidoglycolate dehydrogenase
LLPFGGYKSDGIALMVKLFAARLDRRFFSYQAEENDNGDGARPKRGRDSLL